MVDPNKYDMSMPTSSRPVYDPRAPEPNFYIPRKLPSDLGIAYYPQDEEDLKNDKKPFKLKAHPLDEETAAAIREAEARRKTVHKKEKHGKSAMMEDDPDPILRFIDNMHDKETIKRFVTPPTENEISMAWFKNFSSFVPRFMIDPEYAPIAELVLANLADKNKNVETKINTLNFGKEPLSPELIKNIQILILDHKPFRCPLRPLCPMIVGASDMLSHFLNHHIRALDLDVCQAFEGQKLLLIFNPLSLTYNQNACLGMILYKGFDCDPPVYPYQRGLTTENGPLHSQFRKMAGFMPVLVMMCLTSWDTMMREENPIKYIPDKQPCNKCLLYVIWLVAPQLMSPVHTTITVYDKDLTTSRSTIFPIRDTTQSQNACKFLPIDLNNLRLSYGDMKLLSKNFTELVNMELIFKELKFIKKDAASPRDVSQSTELQI